MSEPNTNNNTAEQQEEEELLRSQDYIYARNTDHDFVPERQVPGISSLLMEFIRQLRPGMEVYRISVPAIIVSPYSLLEKLSYSCNPNEWLMNAPALPTAEARIVSICKWALSTQTIVPQKGFVGMKPFNPILGEVFRCSWEHPDSETHFIAEQVSHHPPVSACIMYNTTKNIAYTAHFDPKTSFYGNYASTNINSGRYCVYLFDHEEEYEVINPAVIVKGFIWGSSGVESYGELKVICKKSGYSVVVDFKGSGNKVDGKIYYRDDPVYKVYGSFDGVVDIVPTNNSVLQTKDQYNIADIPKQVRKIRPVYEQDENESRRVWHKSVYSILYKEFETANKYKFEVEEKQRKKRKDIQEKKLPEFKPAYFYPKQAQAGSENETGDERHYEWTCRRFSPERFYSSNKEKSWWLDESEQFDSVAPPSKH